MNEINLFVDDLPHKLKIECSLYIYEERYKKIRFFQGKTPSFISWLCPLLNPRYYGENQYIFLEGDEINDIAFMMSGMASMVLPSFENTKYLEISPGNMFGVIDIIGSIQTKNLDLNDWFPKRSQL